MKIKLYKGIYNKLTDKIVELIMHNKFIEDRLYSTENELAYNHLEKEYNKNTKKIKLYSKIASKIQKLG